jgi:hypothetical protein
MQGSSSSGNDCWYIYNASASDHDNSHDVDNKSPFLFANHQCLVLVVIDKLCIDIHDTNFQLGLVNLIDSFIEFSEVIIISHGRVIEALSSYIVHPNHRHIAKRKDNFHKLPNVIMILWATYDGLRKPKLSQEWLH